MKWSYHGNQNRKILAHGVTITADIIQDTKRTVKLEHPEKIKWTVAANIASVAPQKGPLPYVRLFINLARWT